MLRKIFRFVITAIIVLACIRAAIRYNESTDQGIWGALDAIIQGIADVIYRWVPPLLSGIARLFK